MQAFYNSGVHVFYLPPPLQMEYLPKQALFSGTYTEQRLFDRRGTSVAFKDLKIFLTTHKIENYILKAPFHGGKILRAKMYRRDIAERP